MVTSKSAMCCFEGVILSCLAVCTCLKLQAKQNGTTYVALKFSFPKFAFMFEFSMSLTTVISSHHEDHHVVIMVAQCIFVAHEPLLLLLQPCLLRRVVGIVAHEPLCLGCFCLGCGLVASWMVFGVMLWGLVCGWCFLASWLR